jgi:Uma2 family endonuclease
MSQSTVSESPIQHELPEDVQLPPADLWSDEPPLESDLHRQQIELLISSLECWWHDRQDFYASGNLTIYYSQYQSKSTDFRGPDFFVVLGTERKERRSWIVWHENGKYPNVIVEILSNSTAAVDRGLKKEIYQDTFRTPDYFWFDPVTLEFKGFHLTNGQYEEIVPTKQGWLWSQQLELFLGIVQNQLRFLTPEGDVVLNKAEWERQRAEQEKQRAEQEKQRAEQEKQRAEQEKQRAEQEKQRAEQAEQEIERLRSQLRSLGVDPER